MDIFAPFQKFADWLTYDVFSIEENLRLGGSINFFIYDTLKIIALLVVINYIMAIIRYYLPIEKIRDYLNSRKWYGFDYFLGSSFGAVTPFCSCSSTPLFVGFLGSGIPLGVTFSFLVTSPLVNEAAIAIFIGVFGLKFTLFYVGASILIGMVSGMLLGRVSLEKNISPDILEMSKNVHSVGTNIVKERISKKLMISWWREGWTLTRKLIPYVVIGISLGAVIHGYVAQSFFEDTLNSGAWWTVPLATIFAVPLYSNAVGVIPVMEVLVDKGVPLGTALAFMMATVGLSLPEALILKRF